MQIKLNFSAILSYCAARVGNVGFYLSKSGKHSALFHNGQGWALKLAQEPMAPSEIDLLIQREKGSYYYVSQIAKLISEKTLVNIDEQIDYFVINALWIAAYPNEYEAKCDALNATLPLDSR